MLCRTDRHAAASSSAPMRIAGRVARRSPAMEIELRDAAPEDAADLIDLRRTIFGESDFMLYAPDEYSDSADALAKRIDGISRSSGSRLIVALADKVLAGFLSVTGSEVPRRRHVGYVVIGVARAHWSRGIGEALLKETLRWAPTAAIPPARAWRHDREHPSDRVVRAPRLPRGGNEATRVLDWWQTRG